MNQIGRKGPPSSSLALGPEPQRHRKLTGDRRQLLREIEKKRNAVNDAENRALQMQTTLRGSLAPLFQEREALLGQLHQAVTRALGPPGGLTRTESAQARRLYFGLLPGNVARSTPTSPPEQHTPPLPSAKTIATDSVRTSLREVFRELARELHPDKQQDPTERERHTLVMKQVTQAYEVGDLAQLLELKNSWLATLPSPNTKESPTAQHERLRRQIKELRQQSRSLTAKLKSLKGKLCQSELGLEALDQQVRGSRELLAFILGFLDGTVSQEEFLLGPPR